MTTTHTSAILCICMDCRLHQTEAESYEQSKSILGVDNVYVLTGAGPEGKLLKRGDGYRDLVADLQLIIDAKGSTKVGICGHYDCAGHAVSNEDHDRDVIKAAELLREALNFDGEIIPMIARPANEGEKQTWILEQIG